MLSIRIDSGTSIDEFGAAARNWLSASDCAVEFPECLTEPEIRYLTNLAVLHIPSDFAYCVLQSIAEFDNTPDDVLREILDTGERSCIESVCLRSDLPTDMREICGQLAQHR